LLSLLFFLGFNPKENNTTNNENEGEVQNTPSNEPPEEIVEPPITGPPDYEGMKVGVSLNFYAKGFADAFKEDYQNYPDNPFTQKFLDDLAPFDTIRFHQWGKQEFNTEMEWSDRQQPDVTIPVGDEKVYTEFQIPYEYHILLCNILQKNCWLNVPTRTSEDYSRQLALLIYETLDVNLLAYIEYSNEVWNPDYSDDGQYGFENPPGSGQFTWATEQGHALGFGLSQSEIAANPGWDQDYIDWAARTDYVVYATTRIGHQFETIFGDLEADRIVIVLPGQLPDSENPNWVGEYPDESEFWTGSIDRLLDGLFNVNLNPYGVMPDAYTVSSYFGLSLNGNAQDYWEDLDRSINEAVIGARVTKGVLDRFNQDRVTSIILVGYEGGQGMGADNNPISVNRDQRMYDAYTRWLDEISEDFDLLNHYSLVSDYSLYNVYGLKEFTGQASSEAPKYRAVEDWVESRSL